MNKIILLLMILLCVSISLAWTPQTDIDLRNYYNIINGSDINATNGNFKNLNGIYHVKEYATSGTGTEANPYTGWESDIQIKLNLSDVAIMFDDGYYQINTGQNHSSTRFIGLLMINNTIIKGIGNVWITQDTNLSLNTFIGNYGHITDWSKTTYNNRIENLNFDGNYNNQNYNASDSNFKGCPVAMYGSNNYYINNIYAEEYSDYGVVVFAGKDSQINNIRGKNSQGNYGTVVFLTADITKNIDVDNIIGENVTKAILDIEDYPSFISVGKISGRNSDAGIIIEPGTEITIESINMEDSGRALNIGQASKNIIVDKLYSKNSNYDGVLIQSTVSNSHIIINSMVVDNPGVLSNDNGLRIKNNLGNISMGSLIVKNANIGIYLEENVSDITIQSLTLDNVTTQLTNESVLSNIFIQKNDHILYDTYFDNDIYQNDNKVLDVSGIDGSNITSGTVLEARIEDKFLKNYGDTGIGNYNFINSTIDINQDLNAQSIHIDSEATTSNIIDIDSINTYSTLRIDQDAAMSASRGTIDIYTSIVQSSGGYLFNLYSDSASSTDTVFNIVNDGVGYGIHGDQNGNKTFLDIDSEATDFPAINIQDIPSNKAMTIASGDKICLDGDTCADYIKDDDSTIPMSWSYLKNYNAYCPAYSAVTGINDSNECTDWWININGDNITANSTFDYNNDSDLLNVDILTVNQINATCCLSVGTIKAIDENSISVQPDGDYDDYFTFKSPSDRPTLKREGGKYIYLESSNVYDMGLSLRASDTYSGTLNYEKDNHRMTLLGKNSSLGFKANSDYDNYIMIETYDNQPQISVWNGTTLKINDSLEVVGNVTAEEFKADAWTNVSIAGSQITSGTIAEARLPTSIYTIELNGSTIDTGTVDEDRIEDKFLKNYGDTGTGNYSFEGGDITIDTEKYIHFSDTYWGIGREGNPANAVYLTSAAVRILVYGASNQGFMIKDHGGNSRFEVAGDGSQVYIPATTVNMTGEANIGGIKADGTGKAVCIKSDGNLGTCTDAVNATGYCTCT